MSVALVIKKQIASLVRAQAPAGLVERTRLETFVLIRLCFSAVVLIGAPVWLLAAAPPPLWQCAAVFSLMAPFASVFALTRGFSLPLAQIISIAGWIASAMALSYGGNGYAMIAIALLLLAVIEAAGSDDSRIMVAAGFSASVGFGLIMIIGESAMSGGVSQIGSAAMLIAVISYACAIGWGIARTNARIAFRERRETMRHEALAQTIGDLVLRQDRGGIVLHASQEAITLFGLPPRELMGRGFFEHIHVGDRPSFLSAVADAVELGETVSCLVRLRRGYAHPDNAKGGPSFAWVELRIRSVPLERRKSDPSDQAAVVTVVRDVTKSKSAEEEISTARATAEQANVWKDRFLANVSHELRTPLNAIIGFAEILSNDEICPKDPARQREYAEIIHSSGQHLLEVVNSILDVSKIDAGSFDILPEPFALPPLLDQCCDMMHLKAESGAIKIVRDYPATLEELVADRRACKQILINLLSNAVKFTPTGGTITLSARPEGNLFIISVSDTGIGIASKDLCHIGDPFFQAQSSTSRSYEGTGLGLSLVRGLVGLHRGAISIESALDEGTCVTIRLPAHSTGVAPPSPIVRIEATARIGAHSANSHYAPAITVKKSA